MPKYDVHLYVQVRVKFADIEGESHEEAVEKALVNYSRTGMDNFYAPTPAAWSEGVVDIEDSDNGPIEALVDVVGDEEYEDTRNYYIRHEYDGSLVLVDMDKRDSEIVQKLLDEMKPGAIKEQSPEAQKLIHEVAEITENMSADELDELERTHVVGREKG
jgi:hypothetical protein